jgi:hypothetical protein
LQLHHFANVIGLHQLHAYSKEDFRLASVIARVCFVISAIGPGAIATGLLAESINDEQGLSAQLELI